MLKFLLILILFKYNFAIEADVNGKNFKFDKFLEQCPNEEGTLANYSLSNMKAVGSVIIFDLIVNYGRNIQQADMELTFERCLSKEALDTCKFLQKLRTKSGCMLLLAKHQIWSPAVNCLEPKLQCPLQKGFHSGTGCKLDFSVFNYIPLGRYYWKIQGKLISPKTQETVLCTNFAGQIIRKS